ncbi:hypothetical protein HHK36_032430 [Tetracentron sinense]|uniref:Uncharacterized protein n=1 Tax=Tetracentron sinense TaxID=13715 RepID=A0A834Y7C1_TETSI|nr:hypothetical protein HHK36_032430 [Tetracentron sinense]
MLQQRLIPSGGITHDPYMLVFNHSNRKEKQDVKGSISIKTQSVRTLERCKTNRKSDNIVFIDIDGDNFHNVITVDVPESLQQTLLGSRKLREDKKLPPGSVISIDDDESSDANSIASGVEGGGDQDSDATSSKGSRTASSQSQNSVESDDECQFIGEIKSPLKLSRSFWKIREQWIKASLRKKIFEDVLTDQSGPEDRASSSGSQSNSQENVEVENTAYKHAEAPVSSSSSNANDEKENLPTFTVTGDVIVGDTSLKPDGKSSLEDLDQNVEQENPSWYKTQSWEKSQFSHRKASVHNREDSSFSVNHGRATCRDKEEHIFRGPSLWSTKEQGERRFNYARACFQDKEENIPGEPCIFYAQSGHDEHYDHSKASFQGEKASLGIIKQSEETQFVHEKVNSCDKDEGIRHESSFHNTQFSKSKYERGSFKGKGNPVSGEQSLCNTRPSDERQVNHGIACSVDRVGPVLGETFFCYTQLRGASEDNHERASCRDKEKPVSEEPCLYDSQQDETQLSHGRACFKEVKEPLLESMPNSQPQEERNPLLYASGGDGPPDVQNYMIVEREKLKETDEYKRAAEEEWAYRKQQLQIQAEEAHRLRKRKREQTMRLLDMERRQKQRVEEMRQTLKKDEETINLKEQLRVEVRKELDKLEMKCNDMASLLRGLGIHVEGGFYPFPREVSYICSILLLEILIS